MTRLNYIHSLDDEDKVILSSMWMNLTPYDNSLSSEGGISQRNFILFISALENIFLDGMISLYPVSYKTEKQFGYFIGDCFYLSSEAEVKRIHLYYNKFYAVRQRKINHQRKDSLLTASSASTT